MKPYLRYSFISFFIFIVFLFVFFKLVKLTVFEKPLKDPSNDQRIQYLRGFIYSFEKDVLAISLKTLSFYANPQNFDFTYKKQYHEFFDLLEVPEKSRNRIFAYNKNFIWIKRFVDSEKINELEEKNLLKLPGIESVKEYKRRYPHGTLASQLIGFLGHDGDGLSGIEYSMDKWLKIGKDLLPVWERENILGNDIVLTINISLQKFIEQELEDVKNQTGAKNVSALVMESDTGNILAMANSPSFDPNQFSKYTNYEIFKNNLIAYNDEPGSTLKPLVMAYFLEQKRIDPNASFHCNGHEKIADFTIRDEVPHGWVDLRKIITYSCNIGMSHIGQTLEKKEIYEMLKAYGFDRPTGIELPGEEKGIIRVPEKMTLRSKVSIPIGQEIGITPLQLLTAYSSLTNKGTIVKPRIVSAIEYNGKIIESFPIKKGPKVLSESTCKKMLSFMRDVVVKGTGHDANIPGEWIAGKTGTAQIFDVSAQTYSKVNTSFVGIVQNRGGKFYLIYVVIRHPKIKEASGGKLAAPIVGNIGTKILQIFK